MEFNIFFFNKLLIGISIGITVWILTNLMLLILKIFKIKNAILTDISFKIEELSECKEFLIKYFDEMINEKEHIVRAPRFTRDELLLFKIFLPSMLTYLGNNNLIRLIKFYGTFDEINILLEGLFNDFNFHKVNEKPLTTDDVSYLIKKKDRIIKLIDLIPKKVNILRNLPDNYIERISPTSLIKK